MVLHKRQRAKRTNGHAVRGSEQHTPKPVLPKAGVDAGVPKAGVDGCPKACKAQNSAWCCFLKSEV